MEVDEGGSNKIWKSQDYKKAGNPIRKAKFSVKPNLVPRKNKKNKDLFPHVVGEAGNEGTISDVEIEVNTPNIEINELKEKMMIAAASSYKGTGNRFQLMADSAEETMNDILSQLKEKNSAKRNARSSSDSNQSLERATTSQGDAKQGNTSSKVTREIPVEKKEKLPPIIVYSQSIDDSINLIKVGLKINEFTIKRYNDNKHSILVANIMHFNKIKEALKTVNAEHYSYCPRSSKIQTMILKDLSPTTKPGEILEELKSLKVENLTFLSVKPFQTRNSLKNNKLLPIFIVQLSPDSKINNLRKIRHINYQEVRWEKLKRKEIIQCKRCQMFQHTASNCSMPYRCVKCEGKHDPGKCPIVANRNNNENREKLFCVLCKNYGHPASYRGCPKYIELRKKMLNRKQEYRNSQQEKKQMLTNFVNPNVSYANVLGSAQKTQNQTENQTQIKSNAGEQNFMNEIKSMLVSIQSQINNFKTILEEEKSRIDILYDLFNCEPMDG